MQGSIQFGEPVSQLLWRLSSFSFSTRDEKLTASVDVFLTAADRDIGKVLSQRQYYIPLAGSEVIGQAEAILKDILAAAVAAEGQFALEVEDPVR